MKRWCFIFLFTISILSQAQNASLFEKGGALYNEGKYQEAVSTYLSILESGQHSAPVYYNLANSYYKLNHIAPSIYYYEKALQLAPNDSDIKNNLRFAQNMTIDAIEELPQTGISKLVNNIIGTFTYEQWAMASIFFMFLFVIVYLLYYFALTPGKKRTAFAVAMLALLCTVFSVVFAYSQFNIEKANRPAIVFAKETLVKSEPNNRSTEVFMLHEGAKVQVQGEVDHWKKIRLADGKVGWIPSGDLKEL